MPKLPNTVVGAGVIGLWQALTLARAGHRVHLIDAAPDPLASSASSYAGAMLAPDCEAEAAPPIVRDHGREGLRLWLETYPDAVRQGSLVVAAARDRGELARFGRMTQGYRRLDGDALSGLEPDLGGRFSEALHFPDEAHLTTPRALAFLLEAVRTAGAEVTLGRRLDAGDLSRIAESGRLIDCRGLAARADLSRLRGVRGERIIIATRDIALQRPVRLLHPRHPLYIVPWGDGRFMVGATVIESEDGGAMTLRSGLELMGAAYALHPAFGEAELVDLGSGVRPAFPDNVPRARVERTRRIIRVNGAYRHGFLLAPVLAQAVRAFIDHGGPTHPLIAETEAP